MTNIDFLKEAAALVARCSPDQRRQLADFAQNFDPATNAAEDRKPPRLATDRRADRHPSFREMFPASDRFVA